MVRKGWLRTLEGTVLSSASISSMLLSRDTNSLRSELSACMSLLSGVNTRFTLTWGQREDTFNKHTCWPSHDVTTTASADTHVCYVVQTTEDVFSGFFGFQPRLFLVLVCRLGGEGGWRGGSRVKMGGVRNYRLYHWNVAIFCFTKPCWYCSVSDYRCRFFSSHFSDN